MRGRYRSTWKVRCTAFTAGTLGRVVGRVVGVVVGRVSDIKLDAKDQTPVVTLNVNSSAGDFSQSSTAAIQTSGLLGEQYLALSPGFADEDMGIGMLKDGDFITDTQSALVLEELIGKFIYSIGDK